MSATTVSIVNYELQDNTHRDFPAQYPNARPVTQSNNSSAETNQAAINTRDAFAHTLTQNAADGTSVSVKVARANLIIFSVSLINFLTSLASGVIVVGLPRIAIDLSLPANLYLWPSSVFGLTAGATLLPAGAIADVVGAKSVDLLGTAVLGVFTLVCGLSQSGIQFVLFRAFQGVGNAMHLPCAVSLVTQYVPSGKRRNLGFAFLGLSMPLGFSVGLVLGGVLVDTVGWRYGFHIAGSVMILQSAAGLKLIPADRRPQDVMQKIRTDIDWVGAFIACTGLAMFSYVLALLSADSNNMKRPSSIVMLTISVVLMMAFPFWMRWQDNRSKPALIPNHLWTNLPFTCVCVLTTLTWGVMNSMELFSSLYFQEVQLQSALQASLRILPNLLTAVLLNLTTGYFIDRAPAFYLVLLTTTLASVSPLLMALINPTWSYWRGAFFAQVLAPLSSDVLFTVGLIVVSEVFPERTQGLAGAVFNTVAYFGWSLGLNSMQVISLLVTKGTSYRDKNEPAALLQGYRASFWAMFAVTVACAGLCVIGLRHVGKVGLKRD